MISFIIFISVILFIGCVSACVLNDKSKIEMFDIIIIVMLIITMIFFVFIINRTCSNPCVEVTEIIVETDHELTSEELQYIIEYTQQQQQQQNNRDDDDDNFLQNMNSIQQMQRTPMLMNILK